MTTKEVSEILGNVTPRRVAELCRTEKMYGIRSDGPFGQWDISSGSLAMYIRYNPEYKHCLKGKNIMTPDVCHEDYTVSELASIFEVKEKEIKKWIRDGHFPCVRFSRFCLIRANTKLPVISVVTFLHTHESKLKNLQDRHMEMLATGHEMEQQVRHLLMLYAYYKSNGYLV